MMGAVVDQVAALAKAAQVFRAVIAGIMIQVSRGQHDAGLPDPGCFLDIRPCRRFTPITTPGVSLDVKPAAIR
jgi:hypothetical protein